MDVLPRDGAWQFEPKWDGFRCLVFRSGGLSSSKPSPASRSIASFLTWCVPSPSCPTKLAVDGELLIAVDGDSASTRCSCACIHVRHVCSS